MTNLTSIMPIFQPPPIPELLALPALPREFLNETWTEVAPELENSNIINYNIDKYNYRLWYFSLFFSISEIRNLDTPFYQDRIPRRIPRC
jgi:hypothetical protein